MVRKQQQYTMNVNQNATEQLLRNPYCSTERTHCDCRSHHVTCELHQVTKNPCSLWKIFLICLLACLVATAITALAFYFGPFVNPTNTTIIVHTDGRSCQDPCASPSTPPPTTTPSPGPETTSSLPDTTTLALPTTLPTPTTTPSPGPETTPSLPDTTTPALPTTLPTSTTVMTSTTTEHEVDIEYESQI